MYVHKSLQKNVYGGRTVQCFVWLNTNCVWC